jgi:hypothetical protein
MYAYVRNNPVKSVNLDGREESTVVDTVLQREEIRTVAGEAAVQSFDRAQLVGGAVAVGSVAVGFGAAEFGPVLVTAVLAGRAQQFINKVADILDPNPGSTTVTKIDPGLGNPFKGKTAAEIDDMFKAKGLKPTGPSPTTGTGGYVNPATGRSYHIDPGGKYKKGIAPPHVDVNRPKGSPLPKKKYVTEQEKVK